ncbi:MAG: hypothetical protein L6Q57_01585 [Alphaproteobacteria bacterium]|nr:hypothetical protein [Alphaproteobacteria bacterium]
MNIPLRSLCLGLALLIYGLAGSPTPDRPGAVEIAISTFLMGAAGMSGLMNVFRYKGDNPLWFSSGQFFLFFGLSVPLLMGFLGGNDPVLIFRDVIGLLFLALPLVLTRLDARWVVLTGLLFSVRALAPVMGWFWPLGDTDALSYFANAPTVLFAALFLSLGGFTHLIAVSDLRKVLLGVACLLLCILPFIAMSWSLQRASLAYSVISVAIFFAMTFSRAPVRSSAMIMIAILAAIMIWPQGVGLWHALAEKTTLYGGNQRWAEIQAVWDALRDDPMNILFGLGWGGTFESPAVAGIRVNFTHSLLSSLLLKAGVTGLILGCLYLLSLLHALTKERKRQPVMVLCLWGPVVIDILLYASYKSLDFGLILVLAAGCAMRSCKLGNAHVSVKV